MYVLAGVYALVAVVMAWFAAAAWHAISVPGKTRAIGLVLAFVGPLVTIVCLYLAGRAAGLWL